MWVNLCLLAIFPLCSWAGRNGDIKPLITTTSAGCLIKQYERIYFYGAIIKVQKNTADIDQCISLCWKFVINNRRLCKAVNYVKTDKRCELMHQEFDVNNRIMVTYFGDRNPNAVYAVPVDCPEKQSTTTAIKSSPAVPTTQADAVKSTAVQTTQTAVPATSTAVLTTSSPPSSSPALTTSVPGTSTPALTTTAASDAVVTTQPPVPQTTAPGGDTSFKCGTTKTDPIGSRRSFHRIVGGTEAKVHSIPWIVSIRLGYTRKNHICGGTLIDIGDPKQSDIVITAAHCVKDEFEPDAIEIVAGGHNLKGTDGEVKLEYDEVVMHEKYDHAGKDNDIAIIKLKTPVDFGDAIQPACLPPAGEKVADGAEGLVAGWGRQQEGDGHPPSETLQQLVVPTVSTEKCQELYKDEDKPKFSDGTIMMCAGYLEGKKDSCQGDSGGPLFFKNANGQFTLQGVVSFGKGCARENRPGVYARVSTYIDWINDNVKKMSSIVKRRRLSG